MDSNDSSVLVLLDLSAAFDTVDHSILLYGLEDHVGIKGSDLHWFRLCLTDRKLFVLCEGTESKHCN